MSSQKSTVRTDPRSGVLPTRRRGHDRVAAILDAAAAVFAVHGFDRSTMTEIAAVSGTAIGSLYRFFPNKDLVADAFFARYTDDVLGRIDALLPDAASLPSAAIVDRLLELFLQPGPDRDAAVLLAEHPRDGGTSRMRLRARIRANVAAVLQAAGVEHGRAATMAPMLVQAMKAVPVLLHEGLDRAAITAEARRMLSDYLASARHSPGNASALASHPRPQHPSRSAPESPGDEFGSPTSGPSEGKRR